MSNFAAIVLGVPVRFTDQSGVWSKKSNDHEFV
jgi:hypothetical protein